jgi:hypothetical protein
MEPDALAEAGPRIAKENPPPLLLEIERALHALDVPHEVLDAWKARRPRDAGS